MRPDMCSDHPKAARGKRFHRSSAVIWNPLGTCVEDGMKPESNDVM
jgi:hypothetical protein